jgi:DNA polymerase III alpha subunit (gram-positive type)
MSGGIHIDKILAMDCETSGINWNAGKSHSRDSVAIGQQCVSWGLIISDTATFKPIDEMYVEIKWNGKANWDVKAEKTHGLSREYLEEHGLDEEDAVVDIVEFIMQYIDIKKPIYCLGHNVATFDIPFMRDMLYRQGIKNIKFGHRCFDSFALSMGTVQEFDSNTLFERLGMKERGDHNALEDARNALDSYRLIHKAWNAMLKGK